jgi:hypothetical protein
MGNPIMIVAWSPNRLVRFPAPGSSVWRGWSIGSNFLHGFTISVRIPRKKPESTCEHRSPTLATVDTYVDIPPYRLCDQDCRSGDLIDILIRSPLPRMNGYPTG